MRCVLPALRLARRVAAVAAVAAVAIAGALPVSAQAQGVIPGPARVETDPQRRQAERDAAFAALAAATNETAARMATGIMWRAFMLAPDTRAADLMNRAVRAHSAFSLDRAMVHLDALIAHAPGWAEGWNQRAFVHFLAARYERSVADCAEALAREPRHLGCMTGMARIYTRHLRHRRRALELLDAATALNRWVAERRLYEELVAPE